MAEQQGASSSWYDWGAGIVNYASDTLNK